MVNKSRLRIWAIVILIVANFLVWSTVGYEGRAGYLTVSFLSVGQGDAILIEGPTHLQVLIDSGAPGKLAVPLAKAMPWYDRSIDLVIATHPDNDHIGSLPWVFERYDVANFMQPQITGETGVAREVAYRSEKEGSPIIFAKRGQVVDLGGGAKLYILFPDVDVSDRDTNDASIIAKLVYGSTSVILTGDASAKVEKYLVDIDPASLDADILKLGHHGSKTSSAEEFLKAVSPNLAVVSASADNRYGHPNQEVLDRLAALGIPYLATETFDQTKTITLVSDGFQFVEK